MSQTKCTAFNAVAAGSAPKLFQQGCAEQVHSADLLLLRAAVVAAAKVGLVVM
jgi:hypothetical protein